VAVAYQYSTCPVHGLQPHITEQPNHVLHLLLTLMTGIWALAWIYVAVRRRPMQCQACVGQLLGAHTPLALPPASAPGVPPPRIHETSALRHIPVTVVADSVAGLYVTVRNQRDEVVKLLWDDSTCTGPNGRTLGRLIKKGIGVAGPQAATPIVPGATLVESCVPEGGLPMASNGQGALYLVFETALGKETWQASVHFGIAGEPQGGDAYRS
jgi:hypothetical protein